jgi:hypothetical protein
MLIERGADPNVNTDNPCACTPLQVAMRSDNKEVVKALLNSQHRQRKRKLESV